MTIFTREDVDELRAHSTNGYNFPILNSIADRIEAQLATTETRGTRQPEWRGARFCFPEETRCVHDKTLQEYCDICSRHHASKDWLE